MRSKRSCSLVRPSHEVRQNTSRDARPSKIRTTRIATEVARSSQCRVVQRPACDTTNCLRSPSSNSVSRNGEMPVLRTSDSKPSSEPLMIPHRSSLVEICTASRRSTSLLEIVGRNPMCARTGLNPRGPDHCRATVTRRHWEATSLGGHSHLASAADSAAGATVEVAAEGSAVAAADVSPIPHIALCSCVLPFRPPNGLSVG